MRSCFSTLGCSERSLDEILATAQAFCVRDLEIRGIGGVMDNREIADFSAANIERTKERLAKAGIGVRVIGASASFHDPNEREASLAEATAAVRVASALGAPYIRVFGNLLGSDPQRATASAIEGLRRLSEIAAEAGVTALLETHGDFRDAPSLCPILEALGDCAGFGLIWDVMHTYFATGRDFLPLYRLLRPYIKHVHFKDCTAERRQVIPGEGDIPLEEILAQLHTDGFNGCVSLEWERKWHPELPPIEDALRATAVFLQPYLG